MYQNRMSTVAILALALQMSGQPGWAQSNDQAAARLPVYLCQFGGVAHVYAFKQAEDGQWQGLGQLQGWTVTEQNGGLVARNATDAIMLGDGSASLLQEGQLVRGQCADPSAELAQLFETEDFSQAMRDDAGDQAPDTPPLDPSGDTSSRQGQADPDLMSMLDPQNWDAAKVAAIIDALNLDTSAKSTLKAELNAAARDPVRIERLIRQIQAAFGTKDGATDDLRAKLRATRQDLAAADRALAAQGERLQEANARLSDAAAKADAAERSNEKLSARLADAVGKANATERSNEKLSARLADAVGRVNAVERSNEQLSAQLAATQRDLAAAAGRDEKMRTALSAALVQLTTAREALGTANKRIVKLGGVPVRQ
ncbi:MAG: hypothetical protein H7317_12495 [Pseudorhodobacter sp.]|nr:hypothetical protein [Pseudorhodobacter sp.]